MKRWVDVEEALEEAARAAGPLGAQVTGALRRFLEDQPRAPELVSRTRAGEILGVHPPHVGRYVEQERLEPVPVAGTAPVYVHDEVKALADDLESERAAREKSREAVAG